jgi:hypothetical protein
LSLAEQLHLYQMEETEMEIAAPKSVPILEVAWRRYAQLNDVSKQRSLGFRRLRLWIAGLGILATLFAILTQLGELARVEAPADSTLAFLLLVIKIFFISIPIVASLLAAFGTRAFRNGDWLITRAAAEEYLKEIYFYRTILQNSSNRREHLENRIGEIQTNLYGRLGGELTFKPYKGPIPPYYNSRNPDSDPGFTDLTGDEYFRFRLLDQLNWHQKKVDTYKQERTVLTFAVLAAGALGAFFAAWGGPLSIWVALTASFAAALLGWQELRNLDAIIKNYSKVILELTRIHDHWVNLELEERTQSEFYKMVRNAENVLWAQSTEYIQFMQEALKEAGLDEEASLVNRVIQESVESEKRTKQAMEDSLVQHTRDVLGGVEASVEESFQGALGSLAEEASSELVQEELEAMGQAVREKVEDLKERASAMTASLARIREEFAHVEVTENTPTEELNLILDRFPKTGEVKG